MLLILMYIANKNIKYIEQRLIFKVFLIYSFVFVL